MILQQYQQLRKWPVRCWSNFRVGEFPIDLRDSFLVGEPVLMELNNILTSTKVKELTLRGVPTLTDEDSISAAAAEMRNHSHGSAVVCHDGRLTGIFTERDLLRVLERGGDLNSPVANVMTSNPQTVTSDDTLFDAIRLMDTGGYRRVPVVDANGAPAGVVDVKTVVHFLVEHFPAAVYNQASHEQLTAKNPEGA